MPKKLFLPALARSAVAAKTFPKACSCGRSYTLREWEQLPGGKLWETDWGEILELRHCVCRSTMSIVLAEGEPES
jgi:hypothetical protein